MSDNSDLTGAADAAVQASLDGPSAGGPGLGQPKRPPERLLGARRFLPLFLVQSLGAFNDNVFKNAFVALLTFRLAEQLETPLTTLVAIAAGIFILPFVLFAPPAGALADRIDKAVMMRGVKLAEIALMLLAAVAYHIQSIGLLYALLFLMGAQSAVFAPIKYGVLPQYLRRDELVRGNGLVQAGTFFAILLGTIVGTNLVLTESGVLWVSIAVVAIAVIGWVASLYAPSAPPDPGAGGLPTLTEYLQAPVSVFRITAADPVVFRTVLAISWFWFVGATYLSTLPSLVKQDLAADETVLTLFLAAFSIGVAIGSVLCGVLARGGIRLAHPPWAALAIAVLSIDIMWATAEPPPSGEVLRNVGDVLATVQGWRVLVDFIGLAIAAGLYLTPLNALYQSSAAPESRGRVVACSNMIDSFFMAISAVLIVVFTTIGLSTGQILGLCGATGLIMTIIVARWEPESLLGRAAIRFAPVRDRSL